MLKVGDKITVKLHLMKNFSQAAAFVTVRNMISDDGMFSYSERYEDRIYLGMAGVDWENQEGENWVHGHEGADVRAFITAAVLSR
jgi:hypothetical protein